MKKSKADFESAMSDLYNLGEELETLLYKIGDSPKQPTEDELMNMVIGIIELHKVRYEKMWDKWNFWQTNEERDIA